ncbi:unnamed protein product [Protopolystoma xenopodis]|uniref:Uncharacterized protein n=1 Tax=Protopolystoma xenopodis TaxID=117903 RepID=A0A448W9U0_9PLAT|nr:unnamed protein product [Protopolystoma xenopodis]
MHPKESTSSPQRVCSFSLSSSPSCRLAHGYSCIFPSSCQPWIWIGTVRLLPAQHIFCHGHLSDPDPVDGALNRNSDLIPEWDDNCPRLKPCIVFKKRLDNETLAKLIEKIEALVEDADPPVKTTSTLPITEDPGEAKDMETTQNVFVQPIDEVVKDIVLEKIKGSGYCKHRERSELLDDNGRVEEEDHQGTAEEEDPYLFL